MDEYSQTIRQKNAELVSRIYAGVLNPADYNRIFEAWDTHFQAIMEQQDHRDVEDFDWAAEFVTHFEQAGQFFDRIGSLRKSGAKEYIESLKYAALVCTSEGSIAFINRHAENLLNGLPPASLFDLPFDPASESTLRRLLESLDLDHGPESVSSSLLRLYPDGDDEPHILIAEPFEPEKPADGAETEAIILLKSVSGVWTIAVEDALAGAFDLTTAELNLISELYRGYSIKEIARRTRRSQATLRTQLSSVLQKTGAKSQSALSRIIAGLVHMIQLKSDGATSHVACIAPRRDQRIGARELSNGLTLEYVESGDLEGVPFYFIQTTTTPTLTPQIVAALKDRGIRLISPVRPGVGRTTRTPLTFTAADWAKLHLELLDTLHVDQFTCGGHCSGGIYALELALRADERCNAALLVDTGAPLSNVAAIYGMHQAPRRLFLAARYFPKAMLTPMKLVAADFYSGPEGERRGVDYFFDGSPADEKVVWKGNNWQVTRDNLEYCFRNVPQLAEDISRWSRNTLPLVKRAAERAHVRYFQGGQNLVHKAKYIDKICRTLPNASSNIIEHAGQLLIYTEPDLFADEVRYSCGIA